jgi:hypothetical protein
MGRHELLPKNASMKNLKSTPIIGPLNRQTAIFTPLVLRHLLSRRLSAIAQSGGNCKKGGDGPAFVRRSSHRNLLIWRKFRFYDARKTARRGGDDHFSSLSSPLPLSRLAPGDQDYKR